MSQKFSLPWTPLRAPLPNAILDRIPELSERCKTEREIYEKSRRELADLSGQLNVLLQQTRSETEGDFQERLERCIEIKRITEDDAAISQQLIGEHAALSKVAQSQFQNFKQAEAKLMQVVQYVQNQFVARALEANKRAKTILLEYLTPFCDDEHEAKKTVEQLYVVKILNSAHDLVGATTNWESNASTILHKWSSFSIWFLDKPSDLNHAQ